MEERISLRFFSVDYTHVYHSDGKASKIIFVLLLSQVI